MERSASMRSEEVERSVGRRPSFRDVARSGSGRDHSSNSENGSTSSRPFHWRFTHNLDFPVIVDEPGMANLLCHLKPQGSQIPTVKNFEEREAYIEIMVKTGQVRNL